MIEKKIDNLFSELTDEEIKMLNNSDIDMSCELDPKTISRISEDVMAKTGVSYIQKSKTCKQHVSISKKFKKILIAAVVGVLLVVSAGATYKFIMPEGLQKQLGLYNMHILTVVDAEKADENSVKTMKKTVSKNGYSVTFEAIVDGYVILPEFKAQLKGYDQDAEIKEDRIYAIFTIARNDGKNVLAPDGYIPACDCCIEFPEYLIAVDGYAPNWAMFKCNPCYYEEGNMLYFVCDITDAGIFADRDLSIILFNERLYDDMIVRMDKNGDYYFTDYYQGLAAIFDFDLDDSFADSDAAAKDMEERPYVYVTNPDYSEADAMIAADKALENVDLSYAIGKHKWHGSYNLQFGEVEHAEDFIKLQANRKNLEKLGYEALSSIVNSSSPEREEEMIAYLEQLADKPIEEMTDDELNDLGDELEAFNAKYADISADFLRERFTFSKFSDGSEYCYIEDCLFLYIPAGSEEARIVIVYGDKIVINVECTSTNMFNVLLEHFPTNEGYMAADMYDYWYLFGVDKESRYASCIDEEQFNTHKSVLRNDQDAVFNLILGYSNYNGTVQVF